MNLINDEHGERLITIQFTEKELLMLTLAHSKVTTSEIHKFAKEHDEYNLALLNESQDEVLNSKLKEILDVTL